MKQLLINDFFSIVRRRGKIYCYNCKRKFVSDHHLEMHRLSKCVNNPNGRPHYSLQYLEDELLLMLLTYLPFIEKVNLITSIPNVVNCHGFTTLWREWSYVYFHRPKPRHLYSLYHGLTPRVKKIELKVRGIEELKRIEHKNKRT